MSAGFELPVALKGGRYGVEQGSRLPAPEHEPTVAHQVVVIGRVLDVNVQDGLCRRPRPYPVCFCQESDFMGSNRRLSFLARHAAWLGFLILARHGRRLHSLGKPLERDDMPIVDDAVNGRGNHLVIRPPPQELQVHGEDGTSPLAALR